MYGIGCSNYWGNGLLDISKKNRDRDKGFYLYFSGSVIHIANDL